MARFGMVGKLVAQPGRGGELLELLMAPTRELKSADGCELYVIRVDVRQPAFGTGVPQDLTAGPIVGASMVAGLAAWLALAVLERVTRHARAAWVTLATLVLVASLGAPLSGRGIDEQSRLVLTLLHLTVGALLIVLLARTSPPARSATPQRNR
jgi:uncharacterized protein DUF6069